MQSETGRATPGELLALAFVMIVWVCIVAGCAALIAIRLCE